MYAFIEVPSAAASKFMACGNVSDFEGLPFVPRGASHNNATFRRTSSLACALVLIAANLQAAGTGPQIWVIIISALAIGLGTYSGGWRIMRAMGKGIVEIETPQGAASGAATSATILASAHLGFGLSTTHVSTGSILGSGVGRGAEVRWSVAAGWASPGS
jgi:phosphate/sulfate permease